MTAAASIPLSRAKVAFIHYISRHTGYLYTRYSMTSSTGGGVGNAQLAKASDLQQLLVSRLDELRRPVMAISRTEEQRQEEAQTIRQLASRLNEVQSKLRVLQSITDAPNRAEDKLRIYTSLDDCRENLLKQARLAEPGAFVSKDVIKGIIDFCTVKNAGKAQPGGTLPAAPDFEVLNSKPSGIPKFKSNSAGGAVRDDQPFAHVDQAEGRLLSTPGVAATPAPVTPSNGATLRTPHTQLSVKTRPSLQLPASEAPSSGLLHTQLSEPIFKSESPIVEAHLSQSHIDAMLRQGNDISDRGSDTGSAAALAAEAGQQTTHSHSSSRDESTYSDPSMRPLASRIKSFSRPDSETEPAGIVRPSNLRQLNGIASFKDRFEPKKEDTSAKDSPSGTNKPVVPRLRLGAALESSNSGGSVPADSADAMPSSPTAAASLTSPVVLQASPRLPPEGGVDTNQQPNIFRTMSRRTDNTGSAAPKVQGMTPGSSVAATDNAAAPGPGAAWRAREQSISPREQPSAPSGGSSILNRISSFNSAAADRSSGVETPAGTSAFNRINSFNSAAGGNRSLKPSTSAANRPLPPSSAPTAAPYIPTAPALALPSPSFKLRPVAEAKPEPKVEAPPEARPETKSEIESTSPASSQPASNPVLAAREQLREQLNKASSRSNSLAKPSPITAAATIARGISQHSPSTSDASAFADGSAAAEESDAPVMGVTLRPTPARAASSSSQPAGRAASGALDNVADLAPSISASGNTEVLPSRRIKSEPIEAAGRASTSDGGLEPPRRVTEGSEELLAASPLVKHFANQQNRRAQPLQASGHLPHAVIAAGHQVAHTGLISAPVRYNIPARLVNGSSSGMNGMDLMMMDDVTVVSMGGYSDDGGLDAQIAQHNPADRDAWLRGRKRGPWGMLLRVLSIGTTAVTIAAATGLAIFAAAALNSGLDELNDRQHVVETSKRPKSRRGRGRHSHQPLLPFLPAPSTAEDTLAAGRG